MSELRNNSKEGAVKQHVFAWSHTYLSFSTGSAVACSFTDWEQLRPTAARQASENNNIKWRIMKASYYRSRSQRRSTVRLHTSSILQVLANERKLVGKTARKEEVATLQFGAKTDRCGSESGWYRMKTVRNPALRSGALQKRLFAMEVLGDTDALRVHVTQLQAERDALVHALTVGQKHNSYSSQNAPAPSPLTPPKFYLPTSMTVLHAWLLYCCTEDDDNNLTRPAPLRKILEEQAINLEPQRLGSCFRIVMRSVMHAAVSLSLWIADPTAQEASRMLDHPALPGLVLGQWKSSLRKRFRDYGLLTASKHTLHQSRAARCGQPPASASHTSLIPVSASWVGAADGPKHSRQAWLGDATELSCHQRTASAAAPVKMPRAGKAHVTGLCAPGAATQSARMGLEGGVIDDYPDNNAPQGTTEVHCAAMTTQADEMVLGDDVDNGAAQAAQDTAQTLGAAKSTELELIVLHDDAHNDSAARDTAKTLGAAKSTELELIVLHDDADNDSAAQDTAQTLGAAKSTEPEVILLHDDADNDSAAQDTAQAPGADDDSATPARLETHRASTHRASSEAQVPNPSAVAELLHSTRSAPVPKRGTFALGTSASAKFGYVCSSFSACFISASTSSRFFFAGAARLAAERASQTPNSCSAISFSAFALSNLALKKGLASLRKLHQDWCGGAAVGWWLPQQP